MGGKSICMSNIVCLSHVGAAGSGYKTLILPLAQGLEEQGHNVTVIGLEYDGAEHPFDFMLLGVANLPEASATFLNLLDAKRADILIVALDIPLQVNLIVDWRSRWKGVLPFKYIGIFPVEADPVSFSWAMNLINMDKALVISQFGTDECRKVGVGAEHIQIGIDTESWRLPTEEERQRYRNDFGFEDDMFIVLTVADNQERKNLSRSMEIFADFIYDFPNVDAEHARRREEGLPMLKPVRKAKYVLVTRERLRVGWNLRDYAQVLGINPDVLIFERGLSFKKLWAVYAVADVLLLSSKAEGLGLPLLEAMAVGTPCLGTNCTAIAELLGEGRGTLIDYLDHPDLSYIDPFGNAHRYFAKRSHGKEQLQKIYENRPDTSKAREYVESRSWDIPVQHLCRVVDGLK